MLLSVARLIVLLILFISSRLCVLCVSVVRKGGRFMDFDFSEDQVMLRGLVREFLTEQVPVAHVRAMMDDERGYDPDLYRRFVQLGMLPFPETYGGAGLGMVEQAIILEEMGRIPYPGPYFATVILAGSAIIASGSSKGHHRDTESTEKRRQETGVV